MRDTEHFIPVHWQVLAVAALASPRPLWAAGISRILRRSHGGVVAPVSQLADLGLLAVNDPVRAARRKQGLRQLVSITPEGRRRLSGCRATVLLGLLDKDLPVDEVLRIAIVAVVVFGVAGYCLVPLARDKKKRLPAERPAPEPLGNFQEEIGDTRPQLGLGFEELGAVTVEAHRNWIEWQVLTLDRVWWRIKNAFPQAVEAYEKITSGADPDMVLDQLRQQFPNSWPAATSEIGIVQKVQMVNEKLKDELEHLRMINEKPTSE